jgi:hypothetical protein
MSWHSWSSLLLLRWWSQASCLSCAGHDALEEIRRTVSDCWRRMGWSVGASWVATALLEFVAKASDFSFVPVLYEFLLNSPREV